MLLTQMTNSGEFKVIIYSNQVVSTVSKKQFKCLTLMSNYRAFSKSLKISPHHTCPWFTVELRA